VDSTLEVASFSGGDGEGYLSTNANTQLKAADIQSKLADTQWGL
jgi:hypothetical protein